MSKARLLRLQNDHKSLRDISAGSDRIEVTPTQGDPPVKYLITYRLKGYVNRSGAARDVHQVDLILPANYPYPGPPFFRFRNELWHPNVFPNGDVCLGLSESNWSPGYEIDQLVYDVGNIILFKEISYNLSSLARLELDERGWRAWISSHRTPLEDLELNVKEQPQVRIVERQKPQVRISEKAPPPPNRIVVKIKE